MINNLHKETPHWAQAIACAALYFACQIFSLYLAQQPGSLAFVAFGSGIAIAYLLQARLRDGWNLGLLLFLSDVSARLLLGEALLLSFALAGITIFQIALATFLGQWLNAGKTIDQQPLRLLSFILIVCCVAPLFAASAASVLLQAMHGTPWLRSWPAWFAGACVGSLCGLPIALMLSRQGLRNFFANTDLARLLAACCFIAAITVFAELELPYPFIYPLGALVVAAIVLPFVEIAMLVSLSTLLTCILLATGHFVPPPMLSYWQILFLFLPIFVTQVPPLLLAASINSAKLREDARILSERSAQAAHAEKAQLYEDMRLQQQASKEAADKMQAILQNAADAIITTNSTGVIESFNRAAEKIYGCEEAQALGQNLSQFSVAQGMQTQETQTPGTQTQNTSPKQAARQHKNSDGHWEVMQQRKNGQHFPAELITSQFQDGGQQKLITIVRDVSERRRIEAVKNDFVATVSHELRTPLTSIRGGLGLVLGGATGQLPAAAEKLVQLAAKNAERLHHLVNDLLDIQEIEEGNFTLKFGSYALNDLLQECVAENSQMAQQYQVHLALAPEVHSAALWIDVSRCKQILSHLLSNACKFSASGAQVEISAAPLAEASPPQMRITVSDHGCGIASEFAPFIFDKFSQADTSDTKAKGGTGLGLALALAIAQHMQLQLSFDSVVGQGSRFYLDVPLAQ